MNPADALTKLSKGWDTPLANLIKEVKLTLELIGWALIRSSESEVAGVSTGRSPSNTSSRSNLYDGMLDGGDVRTGCSQHSGVGQQ